jgi:hypothetical protein
MKLNQLTHAIAISCALLCGSAALAQAGNGSTAPSGGSVPLAAVSVVAGSAIASGANTDRASVAASLIAGVYVITAVSAVADVLTFVLEAPRAASNAANAGSKVSVAMSKSASEAVGVSVGTTVTAVSETLGTALVVSGKVLAFIPNEMGKALLFQSRMPAAN